MRLQEQRELQEDDENKKFRTRQKEYVRSYLDKQVEEKHQKHEYECQLDQKQAEFWKCDTENYCEHDKQRQQIIRDTNKRHQEILLQQIDAKNNVVKKKYKMNTQELLQNKEMIKQLGDRNEVDRQIVA